MTSKSYIQIPYHIGFQEVYETIDKKYMRTPQTMIHFNAKHFLNKLYLYLNLYSRQLFYLNILSKPIFYLKRNSHHQLLILIEIYQLYFTELIPWEAVA
jgi:hypothetical protein